jgi:hypothetical protein
MALVPYQLTGKLKCCFCDMSGLCCDKISEINVVIGQGLRIILNFS